MRLAESTFEPLVEGVQEHVTVSGAYTSSQPEITVPPSVKFTDPGVETVAMMVTSEFNVTVTIAAALALALIVSGATATEIADGTLRSTVTPPVPLTVIVSLDAFELA